MSEDDWNNLLSIVEKYQDNFSDGVCFIGGIAVYAHIKSQNDASREFIAYSHDADFVINLSNYGDLRDRVEVTSNKRLSKHQFIDNGFEFDVYVENQNDLIIPVDEILASSQLKSNLRVACPEHLLQLKAMALIDRKGSSKGKKDEDDINRLLMISERFDPSLLSRMSETMLSEIGRCVSGDSVMRLVSGNPHRAKPLRNMLKIRYSNLQTAVASLELQESSEAFKL